MAMLVWMCSSVTAECVSCLINIFLTLCWPILLHEILRGSEEILISWLECASLALDLIQVGSCVNSVTIRWKHCNGGTFFIVLTKFKGCDMVLMFLNTVEPVEIQHHAYSNYRHICHGKVSLG